MHVPVEKIHFIEYGILSLMLYKAFFTDRSDFTIFLKALCFGYLIGLLDEFIQYLLPNRFGEIIDTIWNGLSVGLIQLSIWGVWRPEGVSKNLTRLSFRNIVIWIVDLYVYC